MSGFFFSSELQNICQTNILFATFTIMLFRLSRFLYATKVLRRNNWINLILASSALIIITYYFLLTTSPTVQEIPSWMSIEIIQEILLQEQTIQDISNGTTHLACQLPQLQPFNSVIMQKLRKKLPPFNCENERLPLLFNSTMIPSPRLLPVKRKINVLQVFGITSCCMRKINGYVGGFSHENVDYGSECHVLSFDKETIVPETWEFLVIECNFLTTTNINNDVTRIIDVHSFIPQNINYSTTTDTRLGPNVLILGIESTSRLNFHRVFPEVHDFLVKNLSAIEIKGYHKIGENTLPNIGALLTGLQPIYNGSRLDRDVQLGCEGSNLTYDQCALIWKRFHDNGYSTFYAEDGVGVDLFYLWRGGFIKPPTDYFLRPLMSAALTLHDGQPNPLTYCYGPRTGFRVVMDYLEKMVVQMEKFKRPYFAFTFTTPYTHDYLNGGRYIVQDISKTLEYFLKEGYLSNTVLFVLSDHGARTGDVRNLYQLFLEDRLPFLYVALPTSIREKFPTALENLKRNADKRLVTPFDVHETLVDLLPSALFESLNVKNFKGLGTSLFSVIPKSRTCETAGIPKEFCSCNTVLFPQSTENSLFKKSAEQVVDHINTLVAKRDTLSKCAVLKLKSNLTSVETVIDLRSNRTDRFRIVFETLPGHAVFEAIVSLNESINILFELNSNSMDLGKDEFTGSLQRINLYREDSWCTRNRVLKPVCYCKDHFKGEPR